MKWWNAKRASNSLIILPFKSFVIGDNDVNDPKTGWTAERIHSYLHK